MGRRVNDALRDRDFAVSVLEKLDRAALIEIERRGRYRVADGYPASSMGEGSMGGGVSDPTGSKAVSFLDCRCGHATTKHVDGGCRLCGCREFQGGYDRDVVGEAVTEIFTTLAELHGLAKIIYKRLALLDHIRFKKFGRQASTGICAACLGDVSGAEYDRLRSGYCQKCYMGWHRRGRPDRLMFERQAQARTDARTEEAI